MKKPTVIQLLKHADAHKLAVGEHIVKRCQAAREHLGEGALARAQAVATSLKSGRTLDQSLAALREACKPAAPADTGPKSMSEVTLSRSEFDTLTASDKAAFLKEGGKLVDDPHPTMTRQEFNALLPKQQSAFCKAGGKLKN